MHASHDSKDDSSIPMHLWSTATQQCHFKILPPTISHNMMTKAPRSSTCTQTTCLIARGQKCLPEGVQENSAVLESQDPNRLSQTKPRGFDGPGRCKQNSVGFLMDVPHEKEAGQSSSRKPTLQTQVSHTLCSSLKASCMAFCSCFPQPFPLKMEHWEVFSNQL